MARPLDRKLQARIWEAVKAFCQEQGRGVVTLGGALSSQDLGEGRAHHVGASYRPLCAGSGGATWLSRVAANRGIPAPWP